MKFLVVLAASLAICASSAIPEIPGDNSHYVEGESRYIWFPDGDGNPVLADLVDTGGATRDSARNGARNAYWLYTRNNRYNQQVLIHGDVNSVRNSNYNPNKPLKVIVHGWNSNGNSAVNTLVKNAFLDVEDANVIVLDWNRAANGLYTTSVWAVPEVGRYLGDFLQWLLQTSGGNWDQVHLVGFSLGAHVVGNAGRQVGGAPRRITGLDPAGPQWGGNSNALNTQSGRYVESIHTDGGFLGIMDPISHADFYPNGGRNRQPGCWVNTCSHSRAYELFAASVRYNRFVARACATLSDARNGRCTGAEFHMGNHLIGKSGHGLYHVTTTNRYPY